MQNQIKLNNKTLEYTLKLSKRARRLRLAVYCDGNFVVTAPRRLPRARIEEFISAKAAWVLKKIAYFKEFPGTFLNTNSAQDYAQYKEDARSLATARLNYFNQFYGFSYNRIRIAKQKTRWGSCSRKGNLNFNYKIALIAPHLADYVIAHELCHLGEFNHSVRFWNLLSRVIPDYAERRKALNGNRLK